MPRSHGFDATFVLFSVPLANTETAIEHTHRNPPADGFLVDHFGTGRLYRGTTQWTDEFIYVRTDVAGTGFGLLLFGQEAQVVATKTITIPVTHTNGMTVGAVGAARWVDAASSSIMFNFAIPGDYTSGDLTLTLFRRSSVAANTAVMQRYSQRQRDATAITAIDNPTAMNFTPGDTNTHSTAFTIAAANFAVGDTIWVAIERLGADGSDSLAGTVAFDGLSLTYTT